LARPFVSEPERPSEPVRDLNSELFSARLETEPSETLRISVRPLNREDARPSEPVRDLNSELFSPRLDAEPSEPVKAFTRPLT